MNGYLYVEEITFSKITYHTIYCVLIPNCGLRWFYLKPATATGNIIETINSLDQGGWLFGGNVR